MTSMNLALIRCSLCDYEGERGLCGHGDPWIVLAGGQIRCRDWRARAEDVEPRYTLRRILADNGGDNAYEIAERHRDPDDGNAPARPLALHLSLRGGRWHARLVDVPGTRPRRAEPLPSPRYRWRDGLLMAAAVVLATWAVTALAEAMR